MPQNENLLDALIEDAKTSNDVRTFITLCKRAIKRLHKNRRTKSELTKFFEILSEIERHDLYKKTETMNKLIRDSAKMSRT